MKKTLFAVCLFMCLNFSYQSVKAQCGITFTYWYAVGPCTTSLQNITLVISGSAASPFSVLWEDGNTSMTTALDTGYHVVCVWDNTGCMQCDTFPVNCVDWWGTTGINKINSESSFDIFPNPSSGNFAIKFKHFIKGGTITILNFLDEIVFREDIQNEREKKIKLNNLSGGIYFVKVFDGDSYYCKKITVEHN